MAVLAVVIRRPLGQIAFKLRPPGLNPLNAVALPAEIGFPVGEVRFVRCVLSMPLLEEHSLGDPIRVELEEFDPQRSSKVQSANANQPG